MGVIKNEFPILEYDTNPNGIIGTNRDNGALFPKICVTTFFREVLDTFINCDNAEIINAYKSEMRKFPVYKMEYKGVEVCIIQAAVGSASIAMMTDFLIGHGVTKIIACGGCGVLVDIPAGDVIIPVEALRDEGASYHYLPPARDIKLNKEIIEVFKSTMDSFNVPYLECKTWTTDAFFRETADMVSWRREEGCKVVEMECSAMAAVAEFRGVMFGELLYSGDILADFDNYDERNWVNNLNAREKLFYLALESAAVLGKG